MKFSQEYGLEFQSFAHAPEDFRQSVETDFINGLELFLNKNFTMRAQAWPIAMSLFHRMSGASLHYHTPVHVLAIFQCAAEESTKLTPAQELAIWFHDAVYDVKAPSRQNERFSADFLKASVQGYVPDETILQAMYYIRVTSDYASEAPYPEDCELILDLDIRHFGWDWASFKKTSDCLETEFRRAYDKKRYEQGRIDFLESMLAKKRIFRTERYHSSLEEYARANLNSLLGVVKSCTTST